MDRSPWLAVNLSLVWPGLGQMRQQQWLAGLSLAALFPLFVSRGVWELLAADGQTTWSFVYVMVAAIIYLSSPWLAYHVRPTQHLRQSVERLPSPQTPAANAAKDPWYSLFLEQLLPGMGHFYAGQTLLGGALLVLGVGFAYLANNGVPSLLPLACSIWAAAGYHAYRVYALQSGNWLALLVIMGVMGLRLTISYSPLWFSQNILQCIVPSTSMQPTLQVDDRTFVHRQQQYQPQHGDIVVFLPPATAIQTLGTGPETLFVKRVIGVPGDQIQIDNGQVWVNRQPLSESYASPPNYTVEAMIVPANEYFVLGDNRNESGDSHVWGTLPAENILGQAYKIYWPPPRVQSLLVTNPSSIPPQTNAVAA